MPLGTETAQPETTAATPAAATVKVAVRIKELLDKRIVVSSGSNPYSTITQQAWHPKRALHSDEPLDRQHRRESLEKHLNALRIQNDGNAALAGLE